MQHVRRKSWWHKPNAFPALPPRLDKDQACGEPEPVGTRVKEGVSLAGHFKPFSRSLNALHRLHTATQRRAFNRRAAGSSPVSGLFLFQTAAAV